MNGETQSPNPEQSQSQPTELEKAAKELGRAFAVYFAWKSTGLLDK